MKTESKGVLIASLVAGLFGCGGGSSESPTPATPSGTTTAQTVKCVGINTCSGKSECGGLEGNTCAGSNKCAKRGWIKVSAEECASKGGKPLGS